MGQILSQLGIEPKILLLQAVGFLCLYLLLRAYLFGPIAHILRTREEEVAGHLDHAAKERASAQQLRVDYEQHLAAIQEEARVELQRAAREGQAERERLVTDARREREDLIRRARTEIELEKQKALLELRRQTVELALEAAGRAVRVALDENAQRRAVDQFIAEVDAAQGSAH